MLTFAFHVNFTGEGEADGKSATTTTGVKEGREDYMSSLAVH